MIDLRLGQEGLRGWDVARRLRSQPGLSELPVLVCSADIEALREIQSDVAVDPRVDALAKPFGVDELTDAIDRLLARPVGG